MTAPSPRALPPYLADDPAATPAAPACLLHIKAVPGARRDEIAGPLGDRLKVRISAPPEGGRANKAICALIAVRVGIRAGAVSVVRGQTNPEKTLRIAGVPAEVAAERLA
jgi:uncharacterized protein (TIGR00251 family)